MSNISGRIRFNNPRLLILITPFILLAPVWLTGKALYWGTPSTQFVPWWWQAFEILRSGQFPLWNPNLGMGAPLLANYQSGLLYPPNWVYLLLAAVGGLPLMAWGQSLLVATHLAWAGWGMARLVRRLGLPVLSQTIGGLAFGLSGYLVARAHFLSITSTVAWMPWILLGAYDLVHGPNRRHLYKFALLLALQWLAGHAQTAWYTALFTVAWLLFWIWQSSQFAWPKLRRLLPWLVGTGLLAFALAAVQLLPTAEYLLQSSRAAQVDPQLAFAYSFWPWRFVTLLAPNFFGSPAVGNFWGFGNYWEDALYVGLLPLALALSTLVILRRAGKETALKQFLIISILSSFLLALGSRTPIFPFLYSYIPTFDLFQAPTRFTLIAIFCLPLLAAFAASHWQRPQGSALYWSRLAVAAALAFLLAALWAGQLVPSRIPATFVSSTAVLGVLALGLSLLNLRAPESNQLPSQAWQAGVALFLALDLLWAGWGLNPSVELDFYASSFDASFSSNQKFTASDSRLYMPRAVENQQKFERFFRFDTFSVHGSETQIRAIQLPNSNLLDGVASANNFDPLLTARYQNWIDALEAAPEQGQASMLARMSVGLIENVDPESNLVTFTQVAYLPRVRWLPCAYIVSTPDTALNLVSVGDLSPDETVVEIPDSPVDEICIADNPQPARLTWIESSPNKLRIAVEAPSSGWLILSDAYYPGWQAEIDGQQVEIYPAESLFRAVQLPSGNYVLEMDYRPLSFRIGIVLSFLALTAIVFLWRTSEHETI